MKVDHCCTSGAWHRRGTSVALRSPDTCLYERLRETSFHATSPGTSQPTTASAVLQGSSVRRTRRNVRGPLPRGNRPSAPPVPRRTGDPARSPGRCHRYARPPSRRSQRPRCASRTGMRLHQPSRQTVDSSRGKQPRVGRPASFGRPLPAQRSAAPSARPPAQQPGSRGASSGSASQVCCACSPVLTPHYFALAAALHYRLGRRPGHRTSARHCPKRISMQTALCAVPSFDP